MANTHHTTRERGAEIIYERGRRKRPAKGKQPGKANLEREAKLEMAGFKRHIAKTQPTTVAPAAAKIPVTGPTKEEWSALSTNAGQMRDLSASVKDLNDLLDEASHALTEHGSIEYAVRRIDIVMATVFNANLLAAAAYEKMETILDRHWSSIAEPDADPVVKLWPELEATEIAFCGADEDIDKAAHAALEAKWNALGNRLASMTPTTAAGIALQLRFMAHIEGHESEGHAHTYERRIVQNLVRMLSGDPNWTAATDILATMGK